MDTGRLLIQCPDRTCIVAAVSGFFSEQGANITDLDQHSTDPKGGRFFMRLELELSDLDQRISALREAFAASVAGRFDMQWQLNCASQRPRMAILVSRHEHALLELLWKHARGELHADISCVMSNHETLRSQVEAFGIEFQSFDVSSGNKAQAHAQMLEQLKSCADLVVLARYMQILPPDWVEACPNRIINIHHSFLPAFVGADPYQQAFAKGVKLIGATAHYVTEQLDEGPIIEQDTARVTHRHSVDDMRQLGRNLERHALARAVQWHLQDRVIVVGAKTIVFSR
ncbi:MAG: formyltetrahydrofolate deformylase [Salinisphaeraceae bacterium]|nr:formyltetrahydrofolate deformylase [Salinisphaeraceae bacterium]